jgi:hypothetical protein
LEVKASVQERVPGAPLTQLNPFRFASVALLGKPNTVRENG